MGCFLKRKTKKKQVEQTATRSRNPCENKPTLLPKPLSILDSQESRILKDSSISGLLSSRSKVKPIQNANRLINTKPKALSAPSSFSGIGQEKEMHAEGEQNEEKQQMFFPSEFAQNRSRLIPASIQPSKTFSVSGPISSVSAQLCSDKKAFNGQPVPLPSPKPLRLPSECAVSSISAASTSGVMKKHRSFRASGSLKSPPGILGSEPLPLPPPKQASRSLYSFTYEELSAATNDFSLEFCIFDGNSSSMYKGFIREEASGQKIEVAISRFFATAQTHNDFVNDISRIFLLQHSNLSRLIGFHAQENACERMLVFERPSNGSLDHLLNARTDGLPIGWSARMKIALGAAQGLAYLHEEGPFQAMYCEFKSPNIHVDKDFTAKLIDYGLSSYSQEEDSITEMTYAAPETLACGLLTPKSNVWSFGMVLLELLTGRHNMDTSYPKDERNLIEWATSSLTDELKLSLFMDSRLKGRFSMKAAKIVADLALRCLQNEASERPTMREAVEILKSVQEMKYSSKFRLKEQTRPKNDNGIPQHFPRPSALPLPRPVLMPVNFSNSQPLISARDASATWKKEKEMSRCPSLNALRRSH